MLVSVLAGFGQGMGHSTNDSVCTLVRKYINEKAVDSIYAMTGPNFRKQITPDNLRTFLVNNLFPAGELKEATFVKNAGPVSVYKAVFSTATLAMLVGADSMGRLEAFAAAGAIRSTARDLLKYAAAEMGSPSGGAGAAGGSAAASGGAAAVAGSSSAAGPVPDRLAKAMAFTQGITFSDNRMRIGLGWIYALPGYSDVLFHDGGTGGYRSYIAIDVKKRMAVVLMGNCAVDLNGEGAELMRWLERN